MKHTIRGAQISVGIHALVLVALFGAGSLMPRQRQILLDFSIAGAANAVTGAAAPPMPKSSTRPRETVTPTAESEDAAALHADRDANQPAPAEQARASAGPASDADAGSGEAAAAQYVRSHFTSIRDRILKNLAYPQIARKMGWAGKVTVSFLIRVNGGVEKVMIVDGSGFTVLDRNAVDTIRRTAPYPKPPATAELVMPIVYRLEN